MENTITCAPEYDQLILRTDVRRQPNGTPVLTSQEVELLRELQQVFDKIDHDKYSNPCVWITIQRGLIESWETWEDAQEYNEIETRDEYEDLWRYYYPDATCWYRCAFSTTEEGYMAFLVNNGRDTACLRFDPREDKVYENVESYYEVYLRYSLDRVKETVRKLEDGTYNSYIEKELPFKYRTGTIPREMLWKFVPEFREYDRDGLSEEEIADFEKNTANMLSEEENAVPHFTSGEFFRLCCLGYREAYPERYNPSLNDVDLYRRLSDGRDDGLSKIRTDSEEELRRWFSGELQEFNGSHPWEVIPGGNATHVNFGVYLDRDGKFHLFLNGKYRTHETVRFFNALCREGTYPVYLSDAPELLERLKGTGLCGIVPDQIPLTYVREHFPEREIIDAIHLSTLEEYDVDCDEVVSSITWHKEKEVNLKDNQMKD